MIQSVFILLGSTSDEDFFNVKEEGIRKVKGLASRMKEILDQVQA